MKNLKANLYVTPITILVGGIVTLVLYLAKQAWTYYLIMIMVGLLCHGLFIKQSNRITNMIKLDPEGKTFNPQKETIKGYVIRMSLFVVIFLCLVFKADIKNNSNGLFDCLLAGLGYLTYRIIFLICILIFKDKEVAS